MTKKPAYLKEIDRVFLINMERRPDRLALAREEMEKAGIDEYQVFRAVDGYELGLQNIRHNHKILRPGMQGCYLSHLMIWREALEHDYENIMIMEDDMKPAPCLNDFMELAWAEKPPDAQMIYLGYETYEWALKHAKRVSVYWQIPGPSWGTHGYILMGRDTIEYLYKRLSFMQNEIDSAIWNEVWPEGELKYYAITPAPFMQRGRGDTDIQKIEPKNLNDIDYKLKFQ